jgi:hypothetical protein
VVNKRDWFNTVPFFRLALNEDWNTFRVHLPGQLSGLHAAFNIWNLRCGDKLILLDRKAESVWFFFTVVAYARATAGRLLRFFEAPAPVMASSGAAGTR